MDYFSLGLYLKALWRYVDVIEMSPTLEGFMYTPNTKGATTSRRGVS